MTDDEALRRAIKALRKAVKDTNHFDHGDYASFEVQDAIERALKAEFAGEEAKNNDRPGHRTAATR